jgi:hypothetical protein
MPMNTSAKCIIVNERASVDFATPPSCASLLQSTQRTLVTARNIEVLRVAYQDTRTANTTALYTRSFCKSIFF